MDGDQAGSLSIIWEMHKRPSGSILVDEILHYLQHDRYMPLREAAEYAGMKPRKLREILPPQLRFRVSARKILVKRSELNEFMEKFREQPQTDLKHLVDEAVEAVIRE